MKSVPGAVRGKDIIDGASASLCGKASVDDQLLVDGNAGFAEAASIAQEALARDVQRRRPGHEHDAPVAELDERGDHRRDPGLVIDTDLRRALGVGREVNDRGAGFAQCCDVAGQLLE